MLYQAATEIDDRIITGVVYAGNPAAGNGGNAVYEQVFLLVNGN